MAKARKAKGGSTVNSTKGKTTTPEPKAGRNLDPLPPTCCDLLAPHMDRLLSILNTIANAPAGATFAAEDGVLVQVLPPTGAANYHADPGVSPFPYWEPVANGGAAPEAPPPRAVPEPGCEEIVTRPEGEPT